MTEDNESNISKCTTPSSSIEGKKRKRSRGKVIEDVSKKVVKRITGSLKESDRRMVELDEKRMIYELQQKSEQQQFQLQIMQLLMCRSYPPPQVAGYNPPYQQTYLTFNTPQPACYDERDTDVL